MTEYKELAARLRRGSPAYNAAGGAVYDGPTALESEAASAIEALEAERDEAQGHIEGKEMAAKAYDENYRDEEARANAAEARCKRLEEALMVMVQRFELYAGPNDIHAGNHDLALLQAARLALQENT